MNLNIDHVLFWMDAIRNNKDRDRILESFWKGQINSKIWLIEKLKSFIDNDVSIDIYGGWTGVLSSLLFQSTIPIIKIRSIDIDPSCKESSSTMNKIEEMEGRFESITEDMINYKSDADVIINTICEHISQKDYETWLSNIPYTSLIVLQSNNLDIPEHIRISSSLEEFKRQSNLNLLYSEEKKFTNYSRYMIIGNKKNDYF